MHRRLSFTTALSTSNALRLEVEAIAALSATIQEVHFQSALEALLDHPVKWRNLQKRVSKFGRL